jgi:hypothetical protein
MTNFDESIQSFVPLKVRKQNGRPKIMPPATYLPSEDRTQDPHILRAIGRAWGWRRRMEAGEFNTVTDLAKALGLVVDEKVVSTGKVLTAEEIGRLF